MPKAENADLSVRINEATLTKIRGTPEAKYLSGHYPTLPGRQANLP